MKSVRYWYFHTSRKMKQAAIAQSVVRNIGSVEVTSSILVSSSELVENKGISRKFSLKCLYFYQIIGEWNS